MKSIKLILSVVLIALISQSCRKGGPWGIRGKGSNVTETRDLSGFDKIHLSIDGDVFYTQDSVYKVEISAQSNILAVLKSEVSAGELKFDYKRNVWDHNKIKITVHSPNIKRLSISGSGDILVQNTVTATNMELSISGSGSIYIPSLNAQSVSAGISGNGNAEITGGIVKTESFTISGSGNIFTENLNAESCVVKVSGSGNVFVNASENLDVTISGSGNVSYKGKPSITSHISGSGSLIHLN